MKERRIFSEEIIEENESEVGIIGYGSYVPKTRVSSALVAMARKTEKDLPEFLQRLTKGLGLASKSIPTRFEDQITIANEALENALYQADLSYENKALKRWRIIVGSESKPYAVGTTALHVAAFNGIGPFVSCSDEEGACNPGWRPGMDVVSNVKTDNYDFAAVIGADVSQAPEGDDLEYSCGAGGAATLYGWGDNSSLVASLIDSVHYSNLILDFFRRDGVPVPTHFGKTTIEAFLYTVNGAMAGLFDRHPQLTMEDFEYVSFHQPSPYLPRKVCEALNPAAVEKMRAKPLTELKDVEKMQLEVVRDLERRGLYERMNMSKEFELERVEPYLFVKDIGNCYSGASPIAFCGIAEDANPGERALITSFGSGAYATSTWLTFRNGVLKKKGKLPGVKDYINRKREIKTPDEYEQSLDIQIPERKLSSLQEAKRWIPPMKQHASALLSANPTRISNIPKVTYNYYRKLIPKEVLMAKIMPINSDIIQATICLEHERIYTPARRRCIVYVCKGELIQKEYTRLAKLESLGKIKLRRGGGSLVSAYQRDYVLIDDASLDELRPGMVMERIVRRVKRENEAGLINYGPTYRPVFRDIFIKMYVPELLSQAQQQRQTILVAA